MSDSGEDTGDVDQTGDDAGDTDNADQTGDDGGDSSTDYTQMSDSGGDTDNVDADQSGDDAGDSENADGDTDNESDGNGGTDLKSLEKTLFADLTPEQMSIKNSELMQNYMDLYETLNHIFDNINKIPKDYNNTRVLSFITDKILDIKDMVHTIITTTYSTKTYVENLTVYKQFLLILKQVDNMLKELTTSKANENA